MIQIDIDMPEKCGLCPLFHAEHPMYCQGVEADRKKKIVAPYRDPRPEWCPLQEVTDSDTISRKQAIDAVSRGCQEFRGIFAECEKNLNELPSAQPDLSEYSDKLWKAAYERGKAEAQQRWIPCSERLPEEDTKVLISYRYKEGEGDTNHVYIDITTYGQILERRSRR